MERAPHAGTGIRRLPWRLSRRDVAATPTIATRLRPLLGPNAHPRLVRMCYVHPGTVRPRSRSLPQASGTANASLDADRAPVSRTRASTGCHTGAAPQQKLRGLRTRIHVYRDDGIGPSITRS